LLKVGLTGGIACGKTTVGEMFVKLGAHLIQADQIARELMSPGQPVYEDVVRHFGEGILNSDRTIMRARLAELTFGAVNQPRWLRRVAELNRLVHPEVVRRQEKWMEEIGLGFPRAVAIVEAALILEAGFGHGFDKLIVVTCDEGQRAERFARRQKVSLEVAEMEVRRRMAAQLPDEEKIKVADFVIDNSGTLEQTEARVREIWRQLVPLNESRQAAALE
jgi:dephospho-CoA kinase